MTFAPTPPPTHRPTRYDKRRVLRDPNINVIFQFLMVAEQYGDSQVSR